MEQLKVSFHLLGTTHQLLSREHRLFIIDVINILPFFLFS